MSHLLDANVFITAKNTYYGLDFAPGFWEWLAAAHQITGIASIEAVRREITDGGDELATWARALPSSFWLPVTAETVTSLRATSEWANDAEYEAAAVSDFLSKADYYLVAQAHALGRVVVTHETPSISLKKIKIPDACKAMGVPWVNTFDLLRVGGARLISGAPPTTRPAS